MSNIKISELDQAGALTGQELIPIEQDNLTVRTTVQQLQKAINIVVSNDIIADANSTTKAPSVSAIKSYTDGLVVGLLNDRGNYTPDIASPGAYPSSGGSGTGGAIQKGDIWFINGNGYLGTTSVVIGVSVRALVNNPSPTTDSDWDILDASLIQATLQSVLDNGNTALNQSIELDSASSYSLLDYESLWIEDNAGNGYFSSTDAYLQNGINDNSIEMYVGASEPLLTIYDGINNAGMAINGRKIQFSNAGGGIGELGIAALTGYQTWTLPNKTGTIALTSDITGSNWGVLGNSGTIPGTNFIGTIDNKDLVFKTYNTERLRIGSDNTIATSSLLKMDGGDINIEGGSVVVRSDMGSYLIFKDDNGNTTTFQSPAPLNNNIISLPNQTGTLALSVNNQMADDNGNITITSTGWGLTGNAGTSAGTNFIGTTDAQDLVFKTNSTEQLRISQATGIVSSKSGIDISATINATPTRIQVYQPTGFYSASIGQNTTDGGFLTLNGTTGFNTAVLKAQNLTATRNYQFPDASGTLALTSDITPSTLQQVTSGTNKNLANGINLQGTGAGTGNTATANINAFGAGAATNNSGNNLNALGANAAYGNSAANVNAIGNNAGFSNSGADVNAFGSNAANGNTGYYVNALGTGAAQGNANSQVNAIGNQTAYNNHGLNVNAIGYQVAYNNYGQAVNAMGYAAAKGNTGSDTNALGTNAALNNEGQYTNAIGNQAAVSNTGLHVNGIGQYAAFSNEGNYTNAIGYSAASGNVDIHLNAIGYEAGKNNEGGSVNAIGYQAALGNTASHVNAIGYQAGVSNGISNSTIISNVNLPSYANYAAATAAITIGAGGSAGNTYLYHDQATNSIGAVRL